ncbi:hypothetical protein J5N97_004129 [Dioscorea zingiberensis]|uniref:Myb-like domain-containing protein n=1 Tax=Dioscorea zingiberensis TaxID=325984 RepID=A0A9D5HR37_9LILI|nr:hypothetical protein J5N97_004129 [Dioscorea zingiberensis]
MVGEQSRPDIGRRPPGWRRGNRMSQPKKKISDMVGPQWSKEELERFYEAYRKYGKDWKKVAGAVRNNRSSDMVETLYTMNKAYLSLPEGTTTLAGLIAMMTDHYNILEASNSDRESNDVSRTPPKPQQQSREKFKLVSKGSDGNSPDLLQNQPGSSSYGCLSLKKRFGVQNHIMEVGNQSCSKKNIRWRPIESRFFLQFMATQVENGLKCDKTFRPQAIHAAIRALKDNFGKDCTDANIHNHLRTLKRKWATITRLRGMSGVGWDEENKKIIMAEDEYKIYVKNHPNEELFINKPIEDYKLLELVCGNDHALGRFARDAITSLPPEDGDTNDSSGNFNVGSTPDEEFKVEYLGNDYGFDTPPPTSPSTIPTSSFQTHSSQDTRNKKKGKKRVHGADFEIMQNVASNLDRVAIAIEDHNPVNIATKLSKACMKLTELGYSARDVAKVYAYYGADEAKTSTFLGAPDIIRQYMAEDIVGPPGQNL